MSHDIAIITVIYNNYTVLTDLFSTLKKQTSKSYHLYIADASSQKQVINIPNIPHTILPIKNKGYAHGVNAGLEKAVKDDYIQYCVINDDVFVKPDFIQSLTNTFETHHKTLFGGKIYYAPGFEYHNNQYEKSDVGNVLWYAGGDVNWHHATAHHRGVDEIDNGQYNKLEKTDFITGCLMCFDKEVLNAVGLWDESYFLYYEDADYCERAKKKGIPIMFIPYINMWHKNAQSTDGSGSDIHKMYQRKAHFYFGMKYAPINTKLHILFNYALTFLK